MKNLSIKQRLIILGIITILGIVSIHYSAKVLSNQEKALLNIHEKVSQIETYVLTVRKYEKDFLARNDMTYVLKLHTELSKLNTHINELMILSKNNDIQTEELSQY